MAISEADVLRIARLARLALTEAEVRAARDQLGRILEYMAELEGLDTGSVAPADRAAGGADALREDEARPWGDRAALLAGAPAADGPYFKVPKVIE